MRTGQTSTGAAGVGFSAAAARQGRRRRLRGRRRETPAHFPSTPVRPLRCSRGTRPAPLRPGDRARCGEWSGAHAPGSAVAVVRARKTRGNGRERAAGHAPRGRDWPARRAHPITAPFPVFPVPLARAALPGSRASLPCARCVGPVGAARARPAAHGPREQRTRGMRLRAARARDLGPDAARVRPLRPRPLASRVNDLGFLPRVESAPVPRARAVVGGRLRLGGASVLELPQQQGDPQDRARVRSSSHAPVSGARRTRVYIAREGARRTPATGRASGPATVP